MNSYYTKGMDYCKFAILVLAVLIPIGINILYLYQNEARKELGYSLYQYQRLAGMVNSEIVRLEVETNFLALVEEDHTYYRAFLADGRMVYIIFRDDKAVCAIFDSEYNLLCGMLPFPS